MGDPPTGILPSIAPPASGPVRGDRRCEALVLPPGEEAKSTSWAELGGTGLRRTQGRGV